MVREGLGPEQRLVPVVLDEAVGDHNHVNQSPWADEQRACRIEIHLGSAVVWVHQADAPDRIRAHAMICFVALILQRLIRARLRAQPVENVASPERALGQLRRIQTHRVVMPNQRNLTGISSIDAEQTAIFNSLGVKKPTANERYANL